MRKFLIFLILAATCFAFDPKSTARPGRYGLEDFLVAPHKVSNTLVICPDDNLQNAYDWLKSSNRNGVMGTLSKTNRRCLKLLPGVYDLNSTTFTADTSYVDIIGDGRDTTIITSDLAGVVDDGGDSYSWDYTSGGTFYLTAHSVIFANFSVENTSSGVQVAFVVNAQETTSGTNSGPNYTKSSGDIEVGDHIKDTSGTGLWHVVKGQINANTFQMSPSMTTESKTSLPVAKRKTTFYNLRFIKDDTFDDHCMLTEGTDGFTWINCEGTNRSFRIGLNGDHHPKMIDCKGGNHSFGGDATGAQMSGTYINCEAIDAGFGGCGSFGMDISSDALFINCTAGTNSFGLGKTCNGTFLSCKGKGGCFGGYSGSGTNYGEFAGTAIGCIALNDSFGSGASGCKLSGTIDNCRITEIDSPIYCEGAVIKNSYLELDTANQDGLVLLDSNSEVYNSIITGVSGTGVSINTDSDTTQRAVKMSNVVMDVECDNDIISLLATGEDIYTSPVYPLVKTSNYSVLPMQAGRIFSNDGATASVKFTLPDAVAGLGPFTFADQEGDATEDIELDPYDGTDTIYDLYGVSMGAGGSMWSVGDDTVDVAKHQVTLYCFEDDIWTTISQIGAWGNKKNFGSPIVSYIVTFDVDDDASTDDYQFDDDAENADEQTLEVSNAIPAYAELVSCQLRCFETVTGSAAMSIDVGTSDGGGEILTAANTDSANDINSTGAGDGPELLATNAAQSIWVNATPGANWNTLDAGRWALQIVYIDYAKLYGWKSP